MLEACKGNAYVTTTHVINSCIVKASKLTRVARVYRGVAGGVLPERFWTPNAQGVRGGVEPAFLSTTYDRGVAMHYASAPNKPAIVFEIQSAREPANRQRPPASTTCCRRACVTRVTR